MNAGGKNYGRILITGGTSGLGLELVRSFLRLGYEVYATGRNRKGVMSLNNNFHFIKVDFSDLKGITTVFDNLKGNSLSFDIIINNAGVLSPPEFTLTDDGIEYSIQVNFLSHLLLDELIIRNSSEADSLTLVSVTSPVYKYIKPEFKVTDKSSYRSLKSYAESKLYLLLIGEYLHYKYPAKNLRFIGYDPGTFSSGIYRMQKKWFQSLYQVAAPFMRSPVKAAYNLVEILEQENLLNGAIYSRRNNFSHPDFSYNEKIDEFLKECHRIIEPYLIR